MIEMNEEQRRRLRDLIEMSDEEYYEKFLADIPLEEAAAFMEEFPGFMEEEITDDTDSGELWKKILEQIQK